MAKGHLFAKKSVAQIQDEFGSSELRRTLGPINLVTLGIGCIIGAGIFVLTGHAAATMAGPAVIYAFVISGLACAFAGLCYAELASTMPVSGSAYSYSYVTLGEVFAEFCATRSLKPHTLYDYKLKPSVHRVQA